MKSATLTDFKKDKVTLTKERRKRLKNPLKLTLVGIFLMIEPFLQIVVLSAYRDIPVVDILKQMSGLQTALWILPVVCGTGLLMVKKWSWYLFIVYSIILTVFNIFALITRRSVFNYVAISETIISFLIMFPPVKKQDMIS